MLRTNGIEDRSEEEGFALLAVLGFMLLLAMFLMPFAASSRVRALTASYDFEHARIEHTARAINDYLAWRLSGDARWQESVEGGNVTSSTCAIRSARVAVSIIPHSRLINLNTAEEPLLKSGLHDLGIDDYQTDEITGQILRFRSPTGDAGEADPEGVEEGYKHAPFEHLAELHDFEQLQTISMEDAGTVFSVQSGRAILTREMSDFGPSQHFTITTKIRQAGATGGDAAVYLNGGTARGPQRVSILEVDPDLPPSDSSGECTLILESDLLRLLEEVLT